MSLPRWKSDLTSKLRMSSQELELFDQYVRSRKLEHRLALVNEIFRNDNNPKEKPIFTTNNMIMKLFETAPIVNAAAGRPPTMTISGWFNVHKPIEHTLHTLQVEGYKIPSLHDMTWNHGKIIKEVFSDLELLTSLGAFVKEGDDPATFRMDARAIGILRETFESIAKDHPALYVLIVRELRFWLAACYTNRSKVEAYSKAIKTLSDTQSTFSAADLEEIRKSIQDDGRFKEVMKRISELEILPVDDFMLTQHPDLTTRLKLEGEKSLLDIRKRRIFSRSREDYFPTNLILSSDNIHLAEDGKLTNLVDELFAIGSGDQVNVCNFVLAESGKLDCDTILVDQHELEVISLFNWRKYKRTVLAFNELGDISDSHGNPTNIMGRKVMLFKGCDSPIVDHVLRRLKGVGVRPAVALYCCIDPRNLWLWQSSGYHVKVKYPVYSAVARVTDIKDFVKPWQIIFLARERNRDLAAKVSSSLIEGIFAPTSGNLSLLWVYQKRLHTEGHSQILLEKACESLSQMPHIDAIMISRDALLLGAIGKRTNMPVIALQFGRRLQPQLEWNEGIYSFDDPALPSLVRDKNIVYVTLFDSFIEPHIVLALTTLAQMCNSLCTLVLFDRQEMPCNVRQDLRITSVISILDLALISEEWERKVQAEFEFREKLSRQIADDLSKEGTFPFVHDYPPSEQAQGKTVNA